jgi:beta-lactamase regulating signal transducer with metallopeptidase domain
MSVLVLGFIALTPQLSKRYAAKWLYYVWLVIVVGLIIPFRFHPDTVLIQMSATPSYFQQVMSGNTVNITDPAIQTGMAPQGLPKVPWYQFISCLWITGVITFIIYNVLKHFRFIKMLNRWSEQANNSQMLEMLQKIKNEMGITKPVKLQVCSCVSSPMLIGFLNPVILLPKSIFSADELSLILRHELVHFQRKDLWYKCLVFLATAIHWFNPLIYLMAKAIAVQCEISCDAEVVYGIDLDGRQRYSETIIGVIKNQSRIQTAFSTNFYGGKKSMKKRIFSIMDTTKKKAGLLVLCIILIGVMITGAVFAISKNGDNEQGAYTNDTLNPTEDIVDTEAVKNTDSGNDNDTKVNDFLSSPDGRNFQAITDKFSKAYLIGDIKTMKSCLSDPKSDKNDFSMEGKSVNYKSLTLKLSPQDIKENTVIAEYEIAPIGQDSLDYLYMEIEKVNNEWKVKYYGLQK